MKRKTRWRLKRSDRAELVCSIIRADLSLPYRVGSERPINFNHYGDIDNAVDIAVEMEEQRPGCTR